jgi:hypothetical protein
LIEEEALPINSNTQVRVALLDFKFQYFSVANKPIDQDLTHTTTRTDSPNFLSTKSYLSAYLGEIETTFKTITIYKNYQIKCTPEPYSNRLNLV